MTIQQKYLSIISWDKMYIDNKQKFNEIFPILKQADTWFLDLETAHDLDTKKLYNDYIEGKKLTPSLKERAKKYVNDRIKEIAVNPKKNIIRLVQIEADKNIYVIDAFKVDIKPLIELIPQKYIAGYNLKFDLSTIYNKYKVYPKEVLDLWLTYLLIEHSKTSGRFKSGLNICLENHLDIKIDKEMQTSDWSGKLSPEQIEYAHNDVKHLRKLAVLHIKYLNKYSLNKVSKPYFKHLQDFVAILEMKFLKTIVLMEYFGIPINKNNLIMRYNEISTKLNKIQKEFDAINLNYNSPKQVVEYLNSIGITIKDSSFETLMLNQDKNPIISKIIEARKYSKLNTMLEEYINKWSDSNSRIYPTFWQLTAKSGRLSSSNPNAQQIPRAIKNEIYGNNTIKLDYPAIEMRIMAEITKDRRLIDAFTHNIDIHKQTASLILNKPISEITKEERQKGKTANFLLIYGGGANLFRTLSDVQYNVKYTQGEAIQVREKFLQSYQGIKRYQDKNGRIMNDLGSHICNTILGRRMLANNYTLANNLPVQGTGADMIKLASVYFTAHADIEKYRIISLIHDEIIVEFTKAEYKEEAKKLLKDSMEYACNYIIKSFHTEVEYE